MTTQLPDSRAKNSPPGPSAGWVKRARRAFQDLAHSRWGRAAREVLHGVLEGDVVRAASAMAFDLFLAAVPLLALAGWVFGQLLQDGSAVHAASLVLGTTPQAVQALTEGQLARFDPATVAPIALIGALWLGSSAAATGMALLETSGGSRPRAWWVRRLIAIAWVIAGTVVFGLGGALALMLSGGPRRLLEALGDADVAVSTAHVLGLCLIYLLATALLAAFFRLAVQRPGVRRRIWPGAVLGTGLVVLTSTGFSFYATRIARFALYYGSLAAVAVTLLWLWLVCLFVLIGAELNFVLEGVNGGSDRPSGPASTRARFGASSQRPIHTPQPSGSSAEP